MANHGERKRLPLKGEGSAEDRDGFYVTEEGNDCVVVPRSGVVGLQRMDGAVAWMEKLNPAPQGIGNGQRKGDRLFKRPGGGLLGDAFKGQKCRHTKGTDEESELEVHESFHS